MSSFYTNVSVKGNKILYRGIRDGKRINSQFDYFPSLFIPSKNSTGFKTIHNEHLAEIKPGTMNEAREFIRKYENVDNFRIYGNTRFEYSFIAQEHPEEVIDWKIELIKIAGLDIEVDSHGGYAVPENPFQEVTTIGVKCGEEFNLFGLKDFDNTKYPYVKYHQFDNEIDLLMAFINFWEAEKFDVVTGWFVRFYDIPYLVNRIVRILGEDNAKRLSPWKSYYARSVDYRQRKHSVYVLSGIEILDYQHGYIKFAKQGASREQYSLDYISEIEIGEKKVSYVEEYGNLNGLYQKNPQLFYEYNIQDVELIFKLEKKLKLLELILTLTYDMKVNYEDAFSQVRMWTIMIRNTLAKDGIYLPSDIETVAAKEYAGAYVKDPLVGLHKWVVSFDLTSLYPHLIMQYNISPEMFVEPIRYTQKMKSILNQGVSIDSLLSKSVTLDDLYTEKVTITPNMQFFWIDKQGFLSILMEKMFADRKKYKKISEDAKAKIERGEYKNEEEKKELENTVAKYDNLQNAKKVSLNSAYGALGNRYFILYDSRQAEAITSAGQLSIRWIGNALNAYLNKLLGTDKDFVIASDTDSVYLDLEDLVTKILGPDPDKPKAIEFLDKVCDEKLSPYIDKCYKELADYVNAFDQKMLMKREAIADKGIWTAKKRYILNVWKMEDVDYAKPKVKVTGLESVKSSTPGACRDKIKRSFEIILNGTNQEMIKFIADFRAEFHKLKPEDVASPRSVNGLALYKDAEKSIPIQVAGALLYNRELDRRGLADKYEKIKEGEKIKFLYLKEPNPFHKHVIGFPSNGLPQEMYIDIGPYIDYEAQFSKTFVEPIKVILDIIKWDVVKRNTLFKRNKS